MKNIFTRIFKGTVVYCLCSCNASTQPYIQHEVAFNKVSDNCAATSNSFKMSSNTNGERYEMDQCLDADFDQSKMSVVRKSDTVVIAFSRKNEKKSLYHLTIDIDTYPRYNFLTVGENTFTIIPAAN